MDGRGRKHTRPDTDNRAMHESASLMSPDGPSQAPITRPSAAFMLSHPAHLIALGFGAGLSRKAPGTAGTLWAWVAFLILQLWLSPHQTGWLIALSLPVGWWASSVTARHMRVLDPGSIVWDEVAAFWLVLWLVLPAGLLGQLVAFGLFRFFDTVKPGPVGWADQLFHQVNPATDKRAWTKAGLGIMLDDLVAAFCTLLVIAVWRFF
jgi:phosphatidylglycerophosphatase A